MKKRRRWSNAWWRKQAPEKRRDYEEVPLPPPLARPAPQILAPFLMCRVTP